MGRRGGVYGRVWIALAVLAGTLNVPLDVADATDGAITLATSSATVAPGAQVTLTAGMPVSSGAGTVSQEIVQTIDPTKVKLTSLADITYPAGWTLTYCSGAVTDCTVAGNFSATTPANSAAWALVKAVKATGTIVSDGSEGGRQVAIAQASGTAVNTAPATVTASGSGDGFQSFFDPGRTRVFNVYHHQGVGANLDCHVIATGATCTGFPFNYGGGTENAAYATVVGTKIWLPTGTGKYSFTGKMGMRCVDIAAVIASGAPPQLCATPFVQLGPENSYPTYFTGGSTAGLSEETQLFVLDSWATTPKIYCLDTATAAPCATPSISLGIPTADSTSDDKSNILKWGDRIYVSMFRKNPQTQLNETFFHCVLVSTGGSCPGWSGPVNQQSNDRLFVRFYELPDASGGTRGVCITGAYLPADQCWDANGTQFAAATYNMPKLTDWAAFSFYGSPVRIGRRVYFSNAQWSSAPGQIICYDAAANGGAGGRCNGETSATAYPWVNYTVTPDPIIENCLWVTGHAPLIKTYNLLTKTEGCSALGSTQVKFAAPGAVPRMGCSVTSSIAGWRSFTLDAPTSGFTGATLTIRDSGGSAISGWTARQVTAGTPLDLSSLTVSTTGQSPSFVIDLAGATGPLTASARVKAIGDSPQLCLRPTAILTCPSGSGPISGLTASSMTVSASGSATDSSSNVSALTPASTSVAITAPTSAQCGATLTGTATLSGSATGVAGATVSLLDSSGNPVLVNGSPVTSTTAADGSYSFGFLFPGAYKVGFADVGVRTVVSTTVTGGGAGSTTDNTAATTLVSNTSTLAVGTNGVVNAAYATPAAAGNDVSSGVSGATQSINVLSNDNAATGRTLTVSSVKFCAVGEVAPNCTLGSASSGLVVEGQGKYTVNASGVVTFTPCSGSNTPVMSPPCTTAFAGQATAVSYQVSDGLGTASATITPSVIPPPTAVADAQTGAFDTNQTYSPVGNDSAGSGATVVASSVRLCPTSAASPFTTTNCSASSVTTADGVYTLDSTTGVVTFDPSPTFTGAATVPVRYVVQDSLGQVASSSITPTVTPPGASVAVANSSSGVVGVAQSVNLLGNDTTAAGVTLTTSSTRLCAPRVNAPNCVSSTVDVPNVGSYSLVNGTVTFTPCTTSVTANCASGVAFTGTATPVGYQVSDSVGRTIGSAYTPTVVPPPTAVADAQTGAFDTNQTFMPLTNDTAGSGASLAVSPAGICLSSVTVAASCTATTLNLVGEGSYTLDATTGVVTFDPDPTFTGMATSIKYAATDSLGQKVLSTITPTVTPPGASVAVANSSSGVVGVAQSVNLLGNDTTAAGVTLTTSSTRLCAPGVNAPNCVSSTVDVPNVGSYSLVNGTVTFTPCTTSVTANCASGVAFTGTATPVGYQVSDSVGRTVSSTYTPTVVPPPVSSPDGSQGVRGEPQTITLISNDAPGVDTSPLLPASIRLCDTTEIAPNCSKTELVVPGEGSYRLNPNGTVVFTPDPTFEGSATPIRYMASDELGQHTTSTVVAKVVPPPAPITDDDTKTGPPNRPIVFDPAANDTPGVVPAGQSGRVALVRTSLRLCGAGQLVPNCTATTLATADGTYTVDIATGWVTFTPRTGFEGVATQLVTYQIANDWTGPTGIGIASAVITPIVDQQASPSALPTTGGIPIDPTGLVLVMFAIGIVVAASASRRRHLLG